MVAVLLGVLVGPPRIDHVLNEIADTALYDILKPVTTHTYVLQVYNDLQTASLNSHLPAFQICD